MQRMLVCALVALPAVVASPHIARAQAAFTNGYIEWSLRPDAPRVPYDAAPFSERYNAYIPPPLMFNADPARLRYMYDMDRYDRAMAFGYALPPGFDPQPPPNPRPRRGLFGLGLLGGN